MSFPSLAARHVWKYTEIFFIRVQYFFGGRLWDGTRRYNGRVGVWCVSVVDCPTSSSSSLTHNYSTRSRFIFLLARLLFGASEELRLVYKKEVAKLVRVSDSRWNGPIKKETV